MKKINFDFIKNVHWSIGVFISFLIFIQKMYKRKLTKTEKDLLNKIKETVNQKTVFNKFDNTEPFNRMGIKFYNTDLASLVKKDFL